MMRRLAVLATVAALFIAVDAGARGRGGGGGFIPREIAPPFRWLDAKDAAVAAASEVEPGLPVMCFLRRAGGAADRQYTQAIFARRDVAMPSRRDFAAFRVDTRTKDGKELVKRYKIRRDGALLWFDAHGNYVTRVDQALKVSHVTGTVQQWGVMLARFEREVVKRVREARGHLDRRRYTSAIKTLEPIIDLKGPPAEDMREVLAAIEERGAALLGKVDKLGHGRMGRSSLLAAIVREFSLSSIKARAREMADAARDTGAEAPAEAATRPSVIEAPDMPDPTIEMMLREVRKDASDGDDAAAPEPASATPATVDADTRSPDALLATSRDRLREGTDLRGADDHVGAFMALTEALDLGALALEKKPGNMATRRFVEGITARRYECYKSLVE